MCCLLRLENSNQLFIQSCAGISKFCYKMLLASKGYQRFKPFLPPERCDQCEVDEMARPPVIPRQRLFLAFIRERQLTVYTYNWLPDVNALLREELHHIAQWHNARSHLLSCILHQKMGLFYHQAFTQHPPDLDTGV
jgi:hypothetical protein